MIIYHNLQSLDQNLLKQIFEYRDGELYWKIQPSLSVNVGDQVGCISKKGYKQCRLLNKQYSLHRLIFLYHYGYLPKYIDHKDNNTLNNRIENLRECDEFQNNWNSSLSKRNKSGVKGVVWNKKHKRWSVSTQYKKKYIWLGSYDTLDEAAKVVKEFREKYHGEFANHG